MAPQIVLASSSPYRRRLLARLGIPFVCDAPHIDETPAPGEAAESLVLRLSRSKAAAVASRHPDALIIASDQTGVLREALLSKPGTADGAMAQLRAASGQQVRFLTGLCVLRTADGRERSGIDICSVGFRSLADAEIADYVRREQPLDCAGSFKAEGLGIALFEYIDTRDPTGLEGLPLIRLVSYLTELGVPVLGH